MRDPMIERFQAVNMPLFEKYSITVDQVWLHPSDENKFSFLMSFPSEEARADSWRRYHEDPLFLEGKEAQATIIENIEWHVLTSAPEFEASRI
jgi:hypothetical protein